MESNILKMKGNDGKEYNLTLSFSKLYKLESKNPEATKEYFEIQNKTKIENEFDLIKVIYTAYLCANLDSNMTFEEFLEIVPTNRAVIGNIYSNLLFPKN